MTPSPLVSGSILGFEPHITIISHRARAPLVGLLNFSVAPRGWGRKGGKERGPRRASESADFAFRQPLARDLHRAVTHRTHLFVLFSLPHSCSLSQCERERERDASFVAHRKGSTPGASTDSIHRGYAIGWSFIRRVSLRVTFSFPRTGSCKQSVLTCSSPRRLTQLPRRAPRWPNVCVCMMRY